MIRKVAGLVLSVFLMSSLPAFSNPYITVDVLTGRILADHDAFDRWYPASLTKLMTIYVTFRALDRGEVFLDTPVILSAAATHVPPSRSGYKPGTVLSLHDAIIVTLVKSANDMATAVAETVGGTLPNFVDQMNSEATRLGMIATHFSSANGLPDPTNYSTARDIAVLAVQLRREFPQYAHFFDIGEVNFGDGRKKIQQNSNNLIGRFTGADGMKTGFICASGFNLVASATRNDRTLVSVVLGAEDVDSREALAAKLLDEGFNTTGSSQRTLVNLQPYGTRLSQASNLHDAICGHQAWQSRMQFHQQRATATAIPALLQAPTMPLGVTLIHILAQPKSIKKQRAGRHVAIPAARPAHH